MHFPLMDYECTGSSIIASLLFFEFIVCQNSGEKRLVYLSAVSERKLYITTSVW
jgi:hypothetical protein